MTRWLGSGGRRRGGGRSEGGPVVDQASPSDSPRITDNVDWYDGIGEFDDLENVLWEA
jgi:hypothetical protein